MFHMQVVTSLCCYFSLCQNDFFIPRVGISNKLVYGLHAKPIICHWHINVL